MQPLPRVPLRMRRLLVRVRLQGKSRLQERIPRQETRRQLTLHLTSQPPQTTCGRPGSPRATPQVPGTALSRLLVMLQSLKSPPLSLPHLPSRLERIPELLTAPSSGQVPAHRPWCAEKFGRRP